jgi:hypothetical protein
MLLLFGRSVMGLWLYLERCLESRVKSQLHNCQMSCAKSKGCWVSAKSDNLTMHLTTFWKVIRSIDLMNELHFFSLGLLTPNCI